MAALEDLIDRIQAAPDGPKVAAVFDYDGTLIDGFSGVALIRARALALQLNPVEVGRLAMAAVRGVRTPEEFEAFLDWSLQAYAGKPVEELREWGRKIFHNGIAPKLRPETWALLEAHRAKGHTIVIASSATDLQIEPIAAAIDADQVLCTRLEVIDGIVTGRVDGPALWNQHKGAAVIELGARIGLDLDESFAYSDGDEDVPLLEAVGHATAVNPRPHLTKVAADRGWPILRGESTSASLSPVSVARTAAVFGGIASGTAVAAGLGLLRGSKRTFLDFAIGLGSDLGLTLAGIDVEIMEGREHIWAHRPCVFIFNHRSNMDGVILMNVLRQEITAIAKQEVKRIPGFGPLFAFGGVAFIDRSNSRQAREAMQPAIDAIGEQGLSLALAPEGTRWSTPGMGPFKKGAFHIARQAGVPVVPIVIRGAGHLMPRGGQLVQSGRVEVVVMPAIDPSEWKRTEMSERVAEVRASMLDVLLKRA